MQQFLALQPSHGNFNVKKLQSFLTLAHPLQLSKSKLNVSLVVNNRVIDKERLVVMTSLSLIIQSLRLFLSQVDLYRTTEEVEVASELVLKEASVRLADVLRKVAEECE